MRSVAGLDMENGVYGELTGTVGTRFVTAMAWNDGKNNFEIYLGNAQSGSLASTGRYLSPVVTSRCKWRGPSF